MARGTHWWNEPPLWAWIVMVVGAVSLAVLLPVALQRSAPVDGAAESAPKRSAASSSASSESASPAASSSSSAASTSPTDEPEVEPAAVVVLGDGDSGGASAWPVLLDDELGNAEFRVAADAGAGYVVPGADGQTIPQLADEVDLADADLVVVFGSRNDGAGVADDVALAAEGMFDGIREAAPDAELLVIGPWFPEPVPAGVSNNRDVIRTAAESTEATFVDPLEEGWFVDRSDLLTATGDPNEAGQAYLAGLIEPEVRALLPG
jgi:GDSL-like Lipase/Acylhydrolase family